MAKFKEIPIELVKPGMTISKLDKSGLNFPYYGVPLPDNSIIQDLISAGVYHVYIKMDPAALALLEPIETPTREIEPQPLDDPNDIDALLESFLTDTDRKEKLNIEDISSVEDMQIQAIAEMKNILNDLKFGKDLDVSTIRGIITEFVLFADKNPQSLANSIRMKYSDDYLCSHSINVCLLSISLSSVLSLSLRDMNIIGLAALLHDVGMLKVPENIYHKPEKLTEHEYNRIKLHPANGYDLISRWDRTVSKKVLQGILQHHERIDGSGYPNSISGDRISIVAQIIHVADMYDALTTHKPYREALAHTDVIKMLYKESGKSLNGKIVKSLVKLVGVYPVSTMLELHTTELAVVFDNNQTHIDKPKVIVFTDEQQQRIPPYLHDLSTTNKKKIKRALSADEYPTDPGNIITGYIATRL